MTKAMTVYQNGQRVERTSLAQALPERGFVGEMWRRMNQEERNWRSGADVVSVAE